MVAMPITLILGKWDSRMHEVHLPVSQARQLKFMFSKRLDHFNYDKINIDICVELKQVSSCIAKGIMNLQSPQNI